MIGATVIDTALQPHRRGVIVVVNAETLDVMVSWRTGMATTLRPADMRTGRYKVIV